MMPNLSRFYMVIWLLVMCPSRGVKWRSFRWCSRQQFSYKFHNRWQLRTVKQNLDSSTCSAPVTSVFAPDQCYFRSSTRKQLSRQATTFSQELPSLQELRYKTWLLDSLNIVLHVNTYLLSLPCFVATSAALLSERAGFRRPFCIVKCITGFRVTSRVVFIIIAICKSHEYH